MLHYINHIKEVRKTIYDNQSIVINRNNLFAYVNAYLNSLRPGMVDFFSSDISKYTINIKENSDFLANGFIDYLQKTKNVQI